METNFKLMRYGLDHDALQKIKNISTKLSENKTND